MRHLMLEALWCHEQYFQYYDCWSFLLIRGSYSRNWCNKISLVSCISCVSLHVQVTNVTCKSVCYCYIYTRFEKCFENPSCFCGSRCDLVVLWSLNHHNGMKFLSKPVCFRVWENSTVFCVRDLSWQVHHASSTRSTSSVLKSAVG